MVLRKTSRGQKQKSNVLLRVYNNSNMTEAVVSIEYVSGSGDRKVNQQRKQLEACIYRGKFQVGNENPMPLRLPLLESRP